MKSVDERNMRGKRQRRGGKTLEEGERDRRGGKVPKRRGQKVARLTFI